MPIVKAGYVASCGSDNCSWWWWGSKKECEQWLRIHKRNVHWKIRPHAKRGRR